MTDTGEKEACNRTVLVLGAIHIAGCLKLETGAESKNAMELIAYSSSPMTARNCRSCN
jgi:hypothetical protein